MKKCSKCKELKEFVEFYTDKTTISGYQSNCIVCKKENYTLRRERYKKDYVENNIELLEYQNNYYKLNKKDRIIYQMKYIRKRYKDDPIFRFIYCLRSRISLAFRSKSWKKNSKTELLIGQSYNFVKEYIENQFTEGMTWENYGKWHIDHILPLASANNEQEIIKLFHYTNLQPLWAVDNLKKGKKILI